MKQLPADLCDSYRAQGYWSDRLLTDFFESAVERSPDRIAVIDERFDPITYAQLATEVSCLAAALQAQGVGRGDKFIIALPNWQQVPVFLLALGYVGAVSVHMPVAGREHEFSSVLKISAAKGIVVPGVFHEHDYVAMIDTMPEDFPALQLRVAVGVEQVRPGWVTYDRLLADAPADVPAVRQAVSASELTSLLFTSGSSGIPKGVMHSANTLGAMNTTVAPLYDLGPEDRIFMGAPLGFSAGMVHGVRLALYLGATLILQETWNADGALKLMVREQATFTLTTPALLRDLMDSPLFPDCCDRLSLRLMFCGGAYVPEDLLRSAQQKMPGTLTSVIWGMTEGIGCTCPPDTPKERIVTTDGRALPGTELKILREDGSEAPAGEQGELVMRGPQRFMGYFNRPELDEKYFMAGGWFRTGDVAAIDAEGYVKITGREKEIIIRGGANISPAEIEAKLMGDPRIAQLAIVDMPDVRLGERLCACVVPNEAGADLTLADLVDIARRQGLAKYKWPERLEIMVQLPVSSAGKIRRAELREQVLSIIATEGGDSHHV
jgi:acyl-CoA synthetase (AMP-forming)/AMP-acid ligase II